MSTRKRQRTAGGAKPVRPLDKAIVAHSVTLTGATQSNSVVFTAVSPVTIKGLRWMYSFIGSTTAAINLFWVLTRVKEGYTVPTIVTTDLAQLFEPEQEVIAWGVDRIPDLDAGAGPVVVTHKDDTKSMRKLMQGDRIVLSILASQNTTMTGATQFWAAF